MLEEARRPCWGLRTETRPTTRGMDARARRAARVPRMGRAMLVDKRKQTQATRAEWCAMRGRLPLWALEVAPPKPPATGARRTTKVPRRTMVVMVSRCYQLTHFQAAARSGPGRPSTSPAGGGVHVKEYGSRRRNTRAAAGRLLSFRKNWTRGLARWAGCRLPPDAGTAGGLRGARVRAYFPACVSLLARRRGRLGAAARRFRAKFVPGAPR